MLTRCLVRSFVVVATACLAVGGGAPAFAEGEAWSAVHAHPGFRAEFSADGVVVIGTEGGAWRFGLRLASWGRGADRGPLAAGGSFVSDRRVEVERGALTEWYVSDARGVEQGFTIAAPPTPVSSGAGPLVLELEVEGAATGHVLEGERDAVFAVEGSDMRLHYSGLQVRDAVGCELRARFVLAGTRLSILVDDATAAYPIEVDPWIWTQQAKLLPAVGGADYWFGWAVALDGDTALVGEPGNVYGSTLPGSVHVFVRSGTTWSSQATLTASDGVVDDLFGNAVAVDGDTAIVGAKLDDDFGTSSGSVYVFVRTGTTWTQQAKLHASNASSYQAFGYSVALCGDTAVIGATGSGVGGSAYVFVRAGTAWTQQRRLSASDAAPGDAFGFAVGVDADTAIVGSRWDDDYGQATGSAYVFARTGTSWSEQAKLLPNDAHEKHWFGVSVDVDGDTALVGAPWDEEIVIHAGAAYVFGRAGTVWSQEAKLLATDGATGDYAGWAVGLDGDTALVGAPNGKGVVYGSGVAYVFQQWGGAWSQRAKLDAADAYLNDEFGYAVALDGDTALVGARWDDDLGAFSGSAYIFAGAAQASAAFRNAGSNPASHASVTTPVLGTTYAATVDLAGTTGHGFAWLVGFATPVTFPLAGGQTLLVNAADPAGELLLLPPVAGPLATYHLPVPADPGLAGFELCTQALHFGGMPPFALSNAQDLFLGQ